ncbi:UbiA family prenyltransferase [Pikeienuella piscinae]|uniref:UbiA family prenyltransferase n=1 Tax=Pikeienuella piscinae TaxID=2748098 RepID=A0A7L5BWW2_9RHOB|nr:UbiA family prenyltransferase [Pikeienuella piscinae]QIE54079.1 UbiA family prenyltransferase [Pikeienuella piscinae]
MTETTVPSSSPADTPLVVDLDGTLIRTDLLYESFWRTAAAEPRAAGAAIVELRHGRAALKQRLRTATDLDPARLPYDEEVLEILRAARHDGATVVLCTASDQGYADAIAAHLGLFDEVHGSDGERNLKGEEKARFLVQRYGAGGYDYIGDSAADLPVWRSARRAIAVGLDRRSRGKVATAGGEIRHLERTPAGPAVYLKAMRPHQWLKNMLVFLPPIAAHDFTPATWFAALAAFVSFSLVASSVYLLNDLLDLQADRAHPRKRERPLASGRLPLSRGTMAAALLLLAGIVVAFLPGRWEFLAAMFAYYVLTTAYSLALKRRLVIDICTLAGLYTLRIIAGAAATGIPLSEWLLGFSVFFFLSLAAVKRQAELVDTIASGREGAAGRAYRGDDLPIVSTMAIAAGYGSVLLLALYLNSPVVRTLYAQPLLLWGVLPVLLYWVSRMAMRAHRGQMDDDPIVFAVRDRVSRLCGGVVGALVLAGSLL